MSDFSLFVILIVAVASGWALARWQSRDRENEKEPQLSRESYDLAHYFSTDIPDYALDAFISAVDVNSDTMETHLTLGAIHRRRGELAQAIRIHENLLQRDALTAVQVSQARFELALDYVKAGLHDRAEEYLQELVEKSDTHVVPALHMLIDLYQDESEWLKASYAAKELMPYLEKTEQERLQHRCSHFYCEQAEQAIQIKDYLSARRHIKRAQSTGAASHRPAILMASLELQLNHPDRARVLVEKQLNSVPAEIAAKVLQVLKAASEQINQPLLYMDTLEKLYRESRSSDYLLLLAPALAGAGKTDQLTQLIREIPPMDADKLPLGLVSSWDQSLISILGTTAALKPGGQYDDEHYQCHHCGYEAREYHWLCPSCRRWETLKTRSQLHV